MAHPFPDVIKGKVFENYQDPKAEEAKVMGILAYFGILALIPLFVKRDSEFAMFHVRQGLFLLILEIAVTVVITVLAMILPALAIVFQLLYLPFLLFWLHGIFAALNLEFRGMPWVGDMADSMLGSLKATGGGGGAEA